MKKMLLFLILITASISACMTVKEPIIVVSFDTEYPVGIGFPDGFTELQKSMYTPSQEQWENAVRRIKGIGIENGVKFQFNFVGITAENNKELVKEILKNHGVSCHTYSHKHQLDLDYTGKLAELRRCKEVLEGITGKKIRGNRFPYTQHDNDSFKALKEAGYEWDYSIWRDKSSLKPYEYKGIKEYPIDPSSDDWGYFVLKGNKDANGLFELLDNDIKSLDADSVYVIILHPWVLATDNSRLDALEAFVSRHKNIKSMDELEGEYGA